MGTNAGCGSRTSCPLDGGCSSIFLVFIRRRNPPTGAPTVVLATRWCAERREGADDASARLAAVFRLSGSRNPAAAGRAPPLRFVPGPNRPLAPRASATAQTPFFTLEFLPGCPRIDCDLKKRALALSRVAGLVAGFSRGGAASGCHVRWGLISNKLLVCVTAL